MEFRFQVDHPNVEEAYDPGKRAAAIVWALEEAANAIRAGRTTPVYQSLTMTGVTIARWKFDPEGTWK